MPRPGEVISHWHHSVEDFNTSALEYFRALEGHFSEKEAPIRVDRIEYHEAGVLSAKRTYLRVSYGEYSFDIGAAPFGKDFFFSWWLIRRLPSNSLLLGCGALLGIPVLWVVMIGKMGLVLGTIAFLVVLGAFVAWVAHDGDESGFVQNAILAVPVVGALYRRFVKPVTYYSEDTRKMFEETVHRIVTQHVSSLITIAKLPPLTAEEARIIRKPNA